MEMKTYWYIKSKKTYYLIWFGSLVVTIAISVLLSRILSK